MLCNVLYLQKPRICVSPQMCITRIQQAPSAVDKASVLPQPVFPSCPKVVKFLGCIVQAGFTSLAHTEEDVERTIQAARETFAEI